MMISAQQIKAARAMLDWSQDALAQAAGLSSNTIYNLETGHISPRSAQIIRKALEDKGFEFFGSNGLQRTDDSTRIYKGVDSCDKFYNDLLSSLKESNGEVGAIFASQDAFAYSLGVVDFDDLERLERLSKFASLKCMLSDANHSSLFIPFFEFRAIPKHPFGPLSSFIYGNKTALLICDGVDYTYHVMKSADVTQKSWNDFRLRWETGLSLTRRDDKQKQKQRI